MYAPPVSLDLWMRYLEWHHEEDRERIVELNLPLVRSIAGQIQQKHGGDLDFEDLFHSGCVGLLSAVDAFDPTRGLAFSSFAVPRIRGAILDDLRKQDSSTRLSRNRKRQIKSAARAVAARRLRAPTAIDTAQELGIDLVTLHRWRSHAQRGKEVSLDRPIRQGDRIPLRLADTMPSGAVAGIERRIVHEESMSRLAELLAQLPERQRLVLHLYYYEGLQQTRIAEILGVTESRVSQIRTRTLAHLRSKFAAAGPGGPDLAADDGGHPVEAA